MSSAGAPHGAIRSGVPRRSRAGSACRICSRLGCLDRTGVVLAKVAVDSAMQWRKFAAIRGGALGSWHPGTRWGNWSATARCKVSQFTAGTSFCALLKNVIWGGSEVAKETWFSPFSLSTCHRHARSISIRIGFLICLSAACSRTSFFVKTWSSGWSSCRAPWSRSSRDDAFSNGPWKRSWNTARRALSSSFFFSWSSTRSVRTKTTNSDSRSPSEGHNRSSINLTKLATDKTPVPSTNWRKALTSRNT
mmetsp:Transcript_95837/g.219662  ORF Transcript_95837/g.219662 Transcript_95837/m.219662 type:complete len:249 (-) Transcript_95837:594-1340(-)